MSTKSGHIDAASIANTLQHFAEIDDVYSAEFHDSLVIQVPPGVNTDVERLKSDITRFTDVEFGSLFSSRAESTALLLPSGPYFLQGRNIHQAWRLYSDHLDAFMQTTVPDDATKPLRRVPYKLLHLFSASDDMLASPLCSRWHLTEYTSQLRYQVVYTQ